MQVALKIWRYDADSGDRELRDYEIEAPEWACLLDVLDLIKDQQDGTLAYRKSCRHCWGGRGGSDREWMQGRGVPRSRQIVFRNLGGIIAREAGVAELGGVAIRGAQHPVERQITQRVYA